MKALFNFFNPTVKGRNIQLDILRGVAILIVLGAHFKLPYPDGALRGVAEFWDTNGALGVDLFFVLSGFLVGGLLIAEHTKHGRVNISRFLVRRGLKIYPLYFVFLGYLIVFPVLKEILKQGEPVEKLLAGLKDYWPNFLFLHTYIGTNPAGHTWSLANEEHFYIVLPLVIGLLVAARRIRWIIALSFGALPLFIAIRMASIQFNDPYAEKMIASHLRLDALFFGVGIRALAEYYPGQFMALRRWRVLLAVAGVLLWVPAVFRHKLGYLYATFGFAVTMLGSGAFLLACYHTRKADFGRWGGLVGQLAKGVAFVGVYSYAIYLWHVTVVRIMERLVATRIYAELGGSTNMAWGLSAIVVSVAAIVSGVVLSRLVEWPVIRLRDRLYPSQSHVPPPAGGGVAAPASSLPAAASVPPVPPGGSPLPVDGTITT